MAFECQRMHHEHKEYSSAAAWQKGVSCPEQLQQLQVACTAVLLIFCLHLYVVAY